MAASNREKITERPHSEAKTRQDGVAVYLEVVDDQRERAGQITYLPYSTASSRQEIGPTRKIALAYTCQTCQSIESGERESERD